METVANLRGEHGRGIFNMNANELANLLEVDSWYKLVTREEIATMLRQQQAEIEALKNWQDIWRPFLKQHFGIEK